MTNKLKYRLQEGEEIVYDLKDLKNYDVVVAVVKKKAVAEKVTKTTKKNK